MKRKFTRGFTLIELLVVVLIIGILASIAVPQYKLAVHKARLGAYLPTIRALTEAEELFYTVNSRYAYMSERESLDISFPKECKPNPTQTWRLNCGNHVTITIFGTNTSIEEQGEPVSLGILYCYDGTYPCGERGNYNLNFRKRFLHQPEGSTDARQAGKWTAQCVDSSDTFCVKLAKSVGRSLGG